MQSKNTKNTYILSQGKLLLLAIDAFSIVVCLKFLTGRVANVWTCSTATLSSEIVILLKLLHLVVNILLLDKHILVGLVNNSLCDAASTSLFLIVI